MDQPSHSPCRWMLTLAACATVSFNVAALGGEPSMAKVSEPVAPMEMVDWKTNTISPVTNPYFFEDPVIRSEIRPVFVYHNIDDAFVTNGGNAQLYALQLRYAITDRLAFIATQDGYFMIDTGLGVEWEGWMDLAAGFKYALIDDQANQFILTPGFTFSFPIGDSEVFQGTGDGEFDLFLSTAKGWGDFHLTGNVGIRLPIDSAQSSILHYSVMADYYASRWFIPFVTATAYTVVSEGSRIGLDSEGYDVINFGSSNAGGVTQTMVGVGFRSRLLDNLDFGFAYEKAVASPEGLTDDRLTFDVSIRF